MGEHKKREGSNKSKQREGERMLRPKRCVCPIVVFREISISNCHRMFLVIEPNTRCPKHSNCFHSPLPIQSHSTPFSGPPLKKKSSLKEGRECIRRNLWILCPYKKETNFREKINVT